MDFQAKAASPLTQRTELLVLPVFEDAKLGSATRQLSKAAGGIVEKMFKRGDLNGNLATTLLLPHVDGCKAERVLLVGFGKSGDALNPDKFEKAVKKIAAVAKSSKATDVCLCLEEVEIKNRDEAWKARQSAKLIADSAYKFDQFKSKAKKGKHDGLKKGLYMLSGKGQHKAINQAAKAGAAIAKGMALTKDLGNLPGNVCTPTYLTKEARKLARGNAKFSAKALNEKQMNELGMGSLLSVSAGSDEPAQLIIMEYKGGKKSQKPVVLVGKGITFDSGGISLKPGAAMDEMKYDMCGAASVFGTMKAITEMQLPLNVVAIVAAAENMPSGRATKPGDIVTSMSGQTIEILNTDAEGRLVLCDALTYAERYKPKAVVDVATLTGACVVALGKHATGLYSNNDDLAQELLQAGINAGDKAWQMPLWDEYQQQLDSNFADMANIGGPGAGSVTAACFLARYAKAYDWAHLDIAGTAWNSGAAKGATGRPVAMLVEYLQQQV
ncbi:leucyl aminopeptidase [Pseudomaricurvus alkylphenolicus]|jgi:leucyl aminopeptidase|uniref:leucyl aminopeptidase n=1 Tax=Pseudomaricurvus alkylphenolicus TaxID=1306991 RepID=UPI0014248B78|nr:leucyl aminopeptidase [Pseudomaricurvus alkylphenolicus]NIB41541.1 leucyl aminopeptidase [Pseudomaricurvus alkylphenolicus]